MSFFALVMTTCAAPAETPEKSKGGPMLRIVCVSSLAEKQDLVVASRNEAGEWKEFEPVTVRSSFVTDWLPCAEGPLYLAERGSDGQLAPKCSFTYPASARRAILVLLPDVKNGQYLGDIIDPAKLVFAKGSTLVVNYSDLPGVVLLGSRKAEVKQGGRAVVTPEAGADGMYRMLAAYQNKQGELVPCHDRYVSANQETRDLLLLFPDPTLGLRVYSLSEFGPFD